MTNESTVTTIMMSGVAKYSPFSTELTASIAMSYPAAPADTNSSRIDTKLGSSLRISATAKMIDAMTSRTTIAVSNGPTSPAGVEVALLR